MEYLPRAWPKLKKRINANNLFIFLDFDGTLAPIVLYPGKAVLPARSRKILRRLAGHTGIKLAFISGRQINDIKRKIGIKNAIYSGNHGLQIEGPRLKFEPLLPAGYMAILQDIKKELQKKTSPIRGAFVNDKGRSLSLHYRLADRNRIPRIKAIFHKITSPYRGRRQINIKPGKMVLEVMPPLKWDKGKVVLWLLGRKVFPKKTRVLPIYLGDDFTDEDAFKALKKKGLTVFVGKPVKSYAKYYLRDPKEVFDFLNKIEQAWQN